MGSGRKGKADDPEMGGIDADDTSSNQEATPIPYFAGEVRMKVIWLTPAYNQRSEEAPATTGKK